ncbi:hypothetical protein [Cytobacillus purgationiresistens]|uniref:Type II secretory pathway component PulF n=1 Tax=Cytobacillus purgationiresistens TaxID=863449 RepID=A0ABU0AEX3_9BACI|nr:hypothetical protein [Cytobacillus purgationiresistens]MDQ0269800.1 type II secretory pathway component PulF [Cytobacillus purgationiresistens]
MQAIIPIVLGLYFSLILVRKWTVSFNPALFVCVTVPTILLALLYPIIATFSTAGIENPTLSSLFIWLVDINTSFGFVGFVAGSTLILSVFGELRKNID